MGHGQRELFKYSFSDMSKKFQFVVTPKVSAQTGPKFTRIIQTPSFQTFQHLNKIRY